MPEEVHQRDTGAILFKKTEEEKIMLNTSEKVDYIYDFIKKYEPLFEGLLQQVQNKR